MAEMQTAYNSRPTTIRAIKKAYFVVLPLVQFCLLLGEVQMLYKNVVNFLGGITNTSCFSSTFQSFMGGVFM